MAIDIIARGMVSSLLDDDGVLITPEYLIVDETKGTEENKYKSVYKLTKNGEDVEVAMEVLAPEAYDDLIQEINEKVTSVYRVKGSTTYTQMIALTDAEVGDVWNVIDADGNNYVCVIAHTPGAASWDILGGSIMVEITDDEIKNMFK